MRGGDQALDLGWSWNVLSLFQLVLVAPAPLDGDIGRDVEVLAGLEQRLEAGQNLPRQGARELGQQIVAEGLDPSRRQLGELLSTETRGDMQVDVLAVLPERACFEPVSLGALDPGICGFRNRAALARGGMDTLAHGRPNRVVICVSLSLCGERADVAVAVSVRIINDPRRLDFVALNPLSFSDRHDALPGLCRTYVTQKSAGIKCR